MPDAPFPQLLPVLARPALDFRWADADHLFILPAGSAQWQEVDLQTGKVGPVEGPGPGDLGDPDAAQPGRSPGGGKLAQVRLASTTDPDTGPADLPPPDGEPNEVDEDLSSLTLLLSAGGDPQ